MKQEYHSNALTNLHIRKQIKESSSTNFELADMFNTSVTTISKWKNREERKKPHLFLSLVILMMLTISCGDNSKINPRRVVAELDVDEATEVRLSNGELIKLKLLELNINHDSVRKAIRGYDVTISVDGSQTTLASGPYSLPVQVGKVQIDCPSIKAYQNRSTKDYWKLNKDTYFRLWPKDGSYTQAGTFVYPLKQKWFANMTQSGNEPVYVNGAERIGSEKVYYHAGHDIGGAEGMDEVVAATDGLVISSKKDTLDGYMDFPGSVRPDVVYIVDHRDWYYRYSHLDSILPSIQPGTKVKKGQHIGFMGKQGASGGWVHLHFDIHYKDPLTGAFKIEDAYAYCWESYVKQYEPAIIAVARPHKILYAGEETTLDGRKSKSFAGEIVDYDWTFCDGTTAKGPVQSRTYQNPGEYNEILQVTDSRGNVDYDFQVVLVYDIDQPGKATPSIQPAYYPTLNIQPGEPVRFFVRTFGTNFGQETWDFGDGSPQIATRSEIIPGEHFSKGKFAETVHAFSEPGDYIVKVERSNEAGIKAIAHLHVVIQDE